MAAIEVIFTVFILLRRPFKTKFLLISTICLEICISIALLCVIIIAIFDMQNNNNLNLRLNLGWIIIFAW